jgi:hypothetical protein
MQRRTCLVVALALMAGCSGTKAAGKKSRGQAGKRPKGPKTMGNLLVEGYVADLKNGSAESRITAANELAAMGSAAKAALPALGPLTTHADAKVSTAAKKAIAAIKK